MSRAKKSRPYILSAALVSVVHCGLAGEVRGQDGPCCFPNATCSVTSPANCALFGGDFMGGRDCEPGLCPGSGACCLPDGACDQLSGGECASVAGEFNGNGTSCATQVCVGACCLPNKECSVEGAGTCLTLQGSFQGRGTECGEDCPTAMPTAFTYQGQLEQNGVPVDGLVDGNFSLWISPFGDDPANQAGASVSLTDIDVVNGLFTVELDFGQNTLNGNARWLQIEIRDSASGDPFTVLLPRVSLNPAPYALQTRGITVLENGNVGIGTKQPSAPLHIKKQAGPAGGTLALDGDTQAFMTFFLNTLIPGRKGYLGFESFPDLTIANEQPGGRIILSTPGSEVFATGGDENLRIIRGTVNANGSIKSGTGFTVTHPAVGQYFISFNSPFSGLPTVTASITGFQSWAFARGESSTGVEVRTWWYEGGNEFNTDYADLQFHFVAVGPR